QTVKKYNVEATPTFALFRGHVFQSSITAALLPKKPTPQESDDQLLDWVSTTVKSFAKQWNASYSKITDHLAFSPTPTEYQIQEGLVKVGFKSVIGMESKQNPGEYLTRESELWKAAGIEFVSYPIKPFLAFYLSLTSAIEDMAEDLAKIATVVHVDVDELL
ncbi:hypothetical protein BGZ50_001186, partial [Haplosporangium sp. Z 11]